jgi:thioredoxin-dependent peroxiredoxin
MAVTLKEGDPAPQFTAKDQNGIDVSLKDYAGKKVVLYFYPADDTPTCTVQACNLRDNFSALKAQGYEIIGISPDDVASHSKFKNKYQLPFTLLSDTDKKIIDAYGVWGQKQMFGNTYDGLLRTTFVIDKNGLIEKIIRRPNSKEHAAEIMK